MLTFKFYLPFAILVLLISASALADEPAPETRVALDRLTRYAAGQPAADRKLVFVYFTPVDREPPAGFAERLTRVVSDIQKFYADESERHGLGRRTIRFARDDKGQAVFHLVKGKRPAAEYLEEGRGLSKGDLIRREARPVLTAAGIDGDQETVVYFCHLRTEKDGRVTGIGPYYGGGGFRNGNAWFTDASMLDAAKLSDNTTMLDDQQYGHISVGRYNTIFIGGAAHELGHSLGLPHDKERADEGVRGTSLMGSGNRTYGEERRGEGRGSFLTLADALRLAAHPMFSGCARDFDTEPHCRIEDLRAEVHGDHLELSGHIIATPGPYAIIAYNDPEGGSDYDATTWTAPLDDEDHFTLRIGQFKPGAAELRLVVCHLNGAATTFHYPIHADRAGVPDPAALVVPAALSKALNAWAAGHTTEARRLSLGTAESPTSSAEVKQWAKVLADIAGPERKVPALADVPASQKEVSLGHVAWTSAEVGWMEPARNHFPREVDPTMPLLNLAGRYYADGLYAHAPARYVYHLDGNWKRFTSNIGLQYGSAGTVRFKVQGDGRELYRSHVMRPDQSRRIDVDVGGCKVLELVTDDAGDGNRGDWAIWAAPKLER